MQPLWRITISGWNLSGSVQAPGRSGVHLRGNGAWLWSTDGRRYADCVVGPGPMVLGHAHSGGVLAITEQAAMRTHHYLMYQRAQGQLGPYADSVRFCTDGSEANLLALRLARALTRRTNILKIDGDFHVQLQQNHRAEPGHNGQRPVAESAGIPPEITETIVIAPYNDIERTPQIVEPAGDEVAAIVVESMQLTFMPLPGLLQDLRALSDSIGALLVFDGVVTGFRLELEGAQDFGVILDLCALGKILGGGSPLVAVAEQTDVLKLTTSGRPGDGRSAPISQGLRPYSKKVRSSGGRFARNRRQAFGALQTIGRPAFQQVVFGDGPRNTVQPSRH
ncbi:aminotransferase class III-fold pyridoxal phosphate-dependent enzyme [Bradyrhizobium sp. CCBAU 51753]|uniref:aminotransferase class III-fold pyridoxal phosphate-dependent enzyme n=1 Tax=Bradyrhizobium sp. CCBAU 51753 TaxID=1325100 RepID=UPI00188CE5A7|nr:aminotransferase class III-fold pyridoxal phosphate-dependent enzyme [Bradyrhizobium sp. CCBAU 51753]QOZ23839.1 hypothetical protein XH93_09575 [Bradyrhizobium sp. CCBAU 51753]